MPDEISIDLQDLEEIMKMLPESPVTGEKRHNALTRSDVLIIAKIVQSMTHKSCAMGFTPEEIGRIKTALNIVNKGILGVGWLVLSTIVVACMTGIGWAIKHGIVDIAESAKKGVGK